MRVKLVGVYKCCLVIKLRAFKPCLVFMMCSSTRYSSYAASDYLVDIMGEF